MTPEIISHVRVVALAAVASRAAPVREDDPSKGPSEASFAAENPPSRTVTREISALVHKSVSRSEKQEGSWCVRTYRAREDEKQEQRESENRGQVARRSEDGDLARDKHGLLAEFPPLQAAERNVSASSRRSFVRSFALAKVVGCRRTTDSRPTAGFLATRGVVSLSCRRLVSLTSLCLLHARWSRLSSATAALVVSSRHTQPRQTHTRALPRHRTEEQDTNGRNGVRSHSLDRDDAREKSRGRSWVSRRHDPR